MAFSLHLEQRQVPLTSLLLDPNNPRFFELDDWKKVPERLYHLDRVQSQAAERLETTQACRIDELEESIRSNGYIPAELIVVRPYLGDAGGADGQEPKFVVIEGNRRLAAIRRIIKNSYDPEQDELVQSLQRIDVLVYKPTGDPERDRMNETILQGIRHISGPKEWGAYQKAHLVVLLRDELGQDWPAIAQRLGLSTRLVGRYYRAYKALRQMMEDPEFGPKAKPGLFSLFDEALKSNALKEWLGWDEGGSRFSNDQTRGAFYELLVGDPDEAQDRRISNPQQMRQLSDVVASGKQDVINRFLNGEVSIEKAAMITRQEPVEIPLREHLLTFLMALDKFPVSQLHSISEEELQLFDKVEAKLKALRSLSEAFMRIQHRADG